MPEIEQPSSPDHFAQERLLALETAGFGVWAKYVEGEILGGRIPELSEKEGEQIASRFEQTGIDLSELTPTVPKKTTEGSVMEAIETDLKNVFGEDVIKEINDFVSSKLMPLRRGEEEEGGETGGSNRFLVMATENLMRDTVAVARAFQSDNNLKEAALSNLEDSILFRIRKGEKRERGFCTKEAHQEHIWHIRGVRDVPPGGLKVIGEFIDQLLSQRK